MRLRRLASLSGTWKAVSASDPNEYAGKKQEQAQDAHEAIRPTNVEFTPNSIRKYLSDEQFRLYKLIWQRFVSEPDDSGGLRPDDGGYCGAGEAGLRLRVTGSVLKFDGHLKFDEEDKRARQAAKDKAAKKKRRLPIRGPGRAG